uniref:Bromodomain adjacent to zinc finger domain protein 1A n=1 Tax=Photinus pyralis TaxID=7054 RepID=A0A1Y1JUG4_PHOPY
MHGKMPLLKDKRFEKASLPNGLLQDEDVFHCVITNEIFRDYDEFCQRIILCNSMVWTCEYTGKTGLTYLEALESEKQVQELLKELSTELRVAVLFLASKTHRNSLTEMVDDLYSFMRDRFFIGENVNASFANNKWKESHILQVIAPSEKQLKDSQKNGHANEKYYPPSSLYSYEVEQLDAEDEDSSHIMVVNASQIKRKRKLTRDKLKFFLKQYITQSDNFIYVIKEKVLRSFGIPSMNFSKIFDGPLPNFGISKQKKKKQKFITEFLVDNQNGMVLEKLAKLRRQEEEKMAEKMKLKEENLKISSLLKEWYMPKEDLELEDHKVLPVPAPVQSKVPEQYIGDIIAIIEFAHTLAKFVHPKMYFPNDLTFDLMERALTQREVSGPLSDVIQMLLSAVFDLQYIEKPQVYSRIDCSGDEKVKDVNGNISLSEATHLAAKAAVWSQEYLGCPLEKLPLFPLTTTEILRMHLLSSGARLTYYGTKMRVEGRGGYVSEDDPALHLRLKYPHIIKALALHNVNNLPISDKLKIIHCLMDQILTYADVRDHIEDTLEKVRQAKYDLKLQSSVERKLEQEYNADKAKIMASDNNVKWNLEKLEKEYDKKRYQHAKELASLQKMAKNQTFLGQDRAFRKYFKIHSIPAVCVSMEDDSGVCLDEYVKQIPHLVGADRATILMHVRKLYDNSSDKENVENKDVENRSEAENKAVEGSGGNEPKVNGIHHPITDEATSLLKCSADPAQCPVHSQSMKQKWSFFYEDKQINELIESLNERGIRESELKQAVISDKEDLISFVGQTPIANLNPYIQTDAESRLRPRRQGGKSKYDDANFGFEGDTDLLTVLQSVLIDKVLVMETNISSGTIGSLQVEDRNKWREMLINKDFDSFIRTYQTRLSKEVHNRKNGSSRSAYSNDVMEVIKEYKDHGQFLSSIQTNCEDNGIDYSTLLNISKEHTSAIQALSIALVQIGRGMEDQYLKKPLGNTHQRSDKGVKGGLLKKWEQSLLSASSYDQIFLHYEVLNKCIFWTRSALVTKCQVCRKQANAESMILCDSCNKGQHLFCFKPKLTAVPKDSWYCKDCEKEMDKEAKLEEKVPRWKKIIDLDTPEDWEGDVESIEDDCVDLVDDDDLDIVEDDEVVEVLPTKDTDEEENNTESDEEEESNNDDPTYKVVYTDLTALDLSENESEESFDENDTCSKCRTGGTLLCCDNCPDMFHVECAEPPLRRVPRGKWFCHNCKLHLSDDAQRSGNISNQRRCAARARDKIHGFARSLRRISETESEGSTSGSENGSTRRSKRRETDRRDDLPLHNAPLQEVLADVLKQEYAWPFIRPVVKNEVPDYYDIITKPMDFGTIKYKLNMGEYKCDADLMDDAALVFDNCNTYNSADDEVYHCGVKLLKYFVNKCHEHGLKVNPKMENEINSPSKPKRLRIDY